MQTPQQFKVDIYKASKNIKDFIRKEKDIILSNRNIYVDQAKIAFSAGAAGYIDIKGGDKVVFFKLDDRSWFIAKTKVEGEGYLVKNYNGARYKRNHGIIVYAGRISKDIIQTLQKSNRNFPGRLEATNYEYNSSPVFKIIPRT